MFKVIDDFTEGNLTSEQCSYSLAAINSGYQYVIKIEKALENLTMLERLYFSKPEKDYFKNIKLNDSKMSDDKVKLCKIKYRGKGKYIDEILL